MLLIWLEQSGEGTYGKLWCSDTVLKGSESILMLNFQLYPCEHSLCPWHRLADRFSKSQLVISSGNLVLSLNDIGRKDIAEKVIKMAK